MSSLKDAIRKIIQDEIANYQSQTQNTDPEPGTVTSVNSDGTVNVQGESTLYPNVGASVVFTEGAQVIMIVADGKRVAVPR